MNTKTFKKARISSCSTKKSTNDAPKSQSKAKKNLENTFTKIIIPSAVMVNSSVLTQRNNTHDKCKGNSSNSQSENTVRLKSCNTKQPKDKSKVKTDRKAEYTKLKAKQIETELQKKPSHGKKSFKKATQSANIIWSDNKPLQDSLNQLHLSNDLRKISNLIQPEPDHLTQIKRNSESEVLSEISKNQRQLLQKISSLQKQNYSLSSRNDSVINEIRYKHEEQVASLKEQLKILNSKLNQQGNKNSVLEKKSENTEKDYASLRQRIHQKDQRISFLQKNSKQLQQNLKTANEQIKGYETHVNLLELNITNLKSVKSSIEEQLKKCEKEKQYIKQNCVEVLGILREEFGSDLKLFSF